MSLKGAGFALLLVLMKKKPAVAFISVPSVSYGEIFDMGAMPPVLSMPLGIMYLSSSLKRSGSASNIFHVDYIVEASKLHAAVEDNEEEIVAEEPETAPTAEPEPFDDVTDDDIDSLFGPA